MHRAFSVPLKLPINFVNLSFPGFPVSKIEIMPSIAPILLAYSLTKLHVNIYPRE